MSRRIVLEAVRKVWEMRFSAFAREARHLRPAAARA
jgi:hypothetical protein